MLAESVMATQAPYVEGLTSVSMSNSVNMLSTVNLVTLRQLVQGAREDRARKYLFVSHLADNVQLAYDIHSKRRVVLKQVHKNTHSLPRLHRLIKTLSALDGTAHILQLHDVIDADHHVTFVYEYLPHGDLADVISRDEGMSESDAVKWIWCVAEALESLHTMDHAHRDLKPDNIGLYRNKEKNMMVKLIDLDRAVDITEIIHSKAVGTRAYMPPDKDPVKKYTIKLFGDGRPRPTNEVRIKRIPPITESFDDSPIELFDVRAADMWSFGIISFAILTGRFPWLAADRSCGEYIANMGTCNHMRAREAAMDCHRPISESMAYLLAHVCAVDSKQRWTASEVISYLHTTWPHLRA